MVSIVEYKHRLVQGVLHLPNLSYVKSSVQSQQDYSHAQTPD